jgi:hypothetical protein
MALNLHKTRQYLQDFDFHRLFINELGWNNPPFALKPADAEAKGGVRFRRSLVAVLSGIHVFEITVAGGDIPTDRKTLAAIHAAVTVLAAENLLIFTDAARTQSLWYWVKREAGKSYARDHLYVKGQPGDLFLSKLAALVVDISELDAQGNIPLTEVANRLKAALDVERVTKKFYGEFDTQRLEFIELIGGIADDHQRRWYASVVMNRLMFIYFLQKKFFLDNRNVNYLSDKLDFSRQKLGKDKFYPVFLNALFFEGFAKPEPARSNEVRAMLGNIRYLNGGLFLPHRVELNHGFPDKPRIIIPDRAFDNVLNLFGRYSWNLDDTPGGEANEINPNVLGYIFEKYINQKEFGAYYTRTEMTGYLCERTIYRLILRRVNQKLNRQFQSISELLLNLDAKICRLLVFEILPSLRLLDPACGSGAFLVAAMKVLIEIYSAILGKVELQFLSDPDLKRWHTEVHGEHRAPAYYIKKSIITDNLFGVDIMEEATEIARLRLFLALVASAQTEDQLEPLPNIDFNILAGNSLIGLLRVDPNKFDEGATIPGEQGRMTLQHGSDLGFTVESKTALTKQEKTAAYVAQRNAEQYLALLAQKEQDITLYKRRAFTEGQRSGKSRDEDLREIRERIEESRQTAYRQLNKMLLDEFRALGIQFEQATWDDKKNDTGKSEKRQLKPTDIAALHPFHWGYEFDRVLADGGFDGILTNPPWEIFKPNSKEFFEEFSALVTKKKMTIHEFEKAQAKLLKDLEIRPAWLEYLSGYPHLSAFYRSAPQYKNQISIVDGKKAGTDINLYKLFTEQCYNLLRQGGYCGIVIPSGIYTDLGTKQLRELLFSKTEVTGLFCFENRKEIFEGVHRSFKFLVLTFERGGVTKSFPAAFMRHDVAELERFPLEGAIPISVDLIRRLSPDSLSVMEFKTPLDVQIAEKMLKFPLLGEELPGKWNLRLTREFDMTNDAYLFKAEPAKGLLPLYEGKMVWQFDHRLTGPRYWMDEKQGRKALLGRDKDTGQKLDYQGYRLGIRAVASNTNERSLITSVVPLGTFCGNSLLAGRGRTLTESELLFAAGILNSFVLDAMLRNKVTTNINMFYIYQLPVPRLTAADGVFGPVVRRAGRLICTTAEFDDLAKAVGLKSHRDGATAPAERAQLRAELDALIAHLYGLTEAEFAYILTTFPLVAQPVKDAALTAYRQVALGLIR